MLSGNNSSQIVLNNGVISVESQLTVTNAQFSDDGDYICNAINTQGVFNKMIATIVVNGEL